MKKESTSTAEIRLHEQAAGNQVYPVATLTKGGYGVVVWNEQGTGGEGDNTIPSLRARKIHPKGEPAGRDKLLTTDKGRAAYFPAVTSQANGFTCIWYSEGAGDTQLKIANFSYDLMANGDIQNVNDSDVTLYPEGSACAIARTRSGFAGVVFKGYYKNAALESIYFRGYRADGTPLPQTLIKITDEGESVFGGVDIASKDADHFVVAYLSGNGIFNVKLVTRVVNLLDPDDIYVSAPTIITEAASPTRGLSKPRVIGSDTAYMMVAWGAYNNNTGDDKIEYRILHDLTPSTQVITLPHRTNGSRIGIGSENDTQQFSISFSVMGGAQSGGDKVYVYKTNYAGQQKLLNQVSTLAQDFKTDSTFVLFNNTNYFFAWQTSNFGGQSSSDVYGRSPMFTQTNSSENKETEMCKDRIRLLQISRL
ncbi:MAG: hypothetical protein JSS53_08085 [Proteobacteria bacterium]|nr:hypothetical protein [Pseudomonadota bacterium]